MKNIAFVLLIFGNIALWVLLLSPKPGPVQPTPTPQPQPRAVRSTITAVLQGQKGIKPKDLSPCAKVSLVGVTEGDIVLLFTTAAATPAGFTPIAKGEGITESYALAGTGQTTFTFPKLKGNCGFIEIAK